MHESNSQKKRAALMTKFYLWRQSWGKFMWETFQWNLKKIDLVKLAKYIVRKHKTEGKMTEFLFIGYY